MSTSWVLYQTGQLESRILIELIAFDNFASLGYIGNPITSGQVVKEL